jgi:hypothetical protein
MAHGSDKKPVEGSSRHESLKIVVGHQECLALAQSLGRGLKARNQLRLINIIWPHPPWAIQRKPRALLG